MAVAWPVAEAYRHDRVLVNTVSACLIAQISRATLYRWMKAGHVEYVRKPTVGRLIYADTLLRVVPDEDE